VLSLLESEISSVIEYDAVWMDDMLEDSYCFQPSTRVVSMTVDARTFPPIGGSTFISHVKIPPSTLAVVDALAN
jgi:hypothetical protein